MTKHSARSFWASLCVCFLIFEGCRDQEFEDHYGRPDWLPSPIYQQLSDKGNFKNFLSCIDKAGYKRTLSSTGYFTVFAPNDAAFTSFFEQQGMDNSNAIDTTMARQIVTYALVYNAFERQRLVDYQSNVGWVPLNSFKRRTAYYSGVYTDTTLDSKIIKVIAANRNGGYVFGDNNNKYIPYFISEYMAAHNLTASDYNYFFPTTQYTGFNVVNASVVTADIRAENGVVHEVDQVILPLPSIDEYIAYKKEYSVFNQMLEKYTVSFGENPEVTSRYRILTGLGDSVSVKLYASSLGFSLNNENFLKAADNDGQSDGWSMFIPNNEALNLYIENVLLEHYASLDEMPPSIIHDFVNAHLWQTTVWPSKFAEKQNTLGEEARFDPHADVIEAKVLSNGILYGTRKVQEADVFRSVFGRAYLDSKYSLMTKFLSRELRSTITSPYVKFTLFLISDAALKAAGYDFSLTNNEWLYNEEPNLAVERWTRLINQYVLFGDLTTLSGEGIVETYGGEFIKYNNNTVFAAGNLDNNEVVNSIDSKQTFNGTVHYLDDILRFPERGVGHYIRDLGDADGEPYKRFFDYLSKSGLYNDATGNILGVSSGVFHTFFIPSNDAIDAFITAKKLPDDANLPFTQAQQDSVNYFILYHLLPKFSIINNGKEEGTFETLYKTVNGDPTTLTISNIPGAGLSVTDMKGETANVQAGPASNVLSNRTIIHQIDKCLQY